jgi:hypothetical protein
VPDLIVLPVKVHRLRDPVDFLTSTRPEGEIQGLFEETNRIWVGARIQFDVEEVARTTLEGSIFVNRDTLFAEIRNHPNYDKVSINVCLLQLHPENGVAHRDFRTTLVADWTSVDRFRTNAHELGHLLDLDHVLPADDLHLMSKGRNGQVLSEAEKESALARAIQLLNEFKNP